MIRIKEIALKIAIFFLALAILTLAPLKTWKLICHAEKLQNEIREKQSYIEKTNEETQRLKREREKKEQEIDETIKRLKSYGHGLPD